MSILRVKDDKGNIIPIPAIKGKSAYEYAKDGGYTGTEAEFAQKLATEYATKTDLTNGLSKKADFIRSALYVNANATYTYQLERNALYLVSAVNTYNAFFVALISTGTHGVDSITYLIPNSYYTLSSTNGLLSITTGQVSSTINLLQL